MEQKIEITLQDGSHATYVASTRQVKDLDTKDSYILGIDQYQEYIATVTDAKGGKHRVLVHKDLKGTWISPFKLDEGTEEMKKLVREAIEKKEGGANGNGV